MDEIIIWKYHTLLQAHVLLVGQQTLILLLM